MAHDLRSPLNAMLMRIEALLSGRRGPLPAEAVADLRKLQASSRGMGKMITDFLDLARMEGTGYKVARDRVDLAKLVTRIVEELQPLATASGLELRWSRPQGEVPVVGDGDRLAQVMSNLVGNAIKFTPSGGRVTVEVESLADAVRTTVRDTGAGIAPELLPHLFNRFTQGPSMVRSAGWGLGLMIVREIVEAHGGRLDVRSEVGKGSAFSFRLPKANAQ
jgi:two-component system phosphate regulon sensor histidine kinase PhoR